MHHQWMISLFEDQTPSWTESPVLPQISVYQGIDWREYCPKVFQLYSWPHKTSHSAPSCNNPQSWSDTSSIASSEAGAHAENLLFACMGISFTEVFTLCSKDSVKLVLHWLPLKRAAETAQSVVAFCATVNIMWFIGSLDISMSKDHLEVLFLLRLLVLSKSMMNSGYFSAAIIKPKHIFSYCLLPDSILYLEASSDGFGLAIMILS